MRITSIVLDHFRVYNGINTVQFEQRDGRNVTIIAGSNGYGKTSFLTSLVWCFYGRAMQDVEQKYRDDIRDATKNTQPPTLTTGRGPPDIPNMPLPSRWLTFIFRACPAAN